MSNLIKQSYEISLWDDVLTAVNKDGVEYDDYAPARGEEAKDIVAQYYKERKICVIGSDSLESPIHVVDPYLTRKTDGTSTLTFSIYAKYFDEETGEFVENPFRQYLTNERKVKLKYYPNGELKWIDFVIKKIDETSDNNKYTYTATDLFINELSKSGYNLEFDLELENNQKTIEGLAASVLAGTDWAVGADSEIIRQTIAEPVYVVELNSKEVIEKGGIVATDVLTKESVNIAAKSKIYVFYSVYENNEFDYFQFLYVDGDPMADQDDVITNGRNCYITIKSLSDISTQKVDLYTHRGERYVRSPKTVYDSLLGRYVNVYSDDNNTIIHGYSESKYISSALVSNYITNGLSITSDSGWDQQKLEEMDVVMFPSFKDKPERDVERFFALKFEQDNNNAFVMNSGFRDHAGKIQQVAKKDRFIFRIKGGIETKTTNGLPALELEPEKGVWHLEVAEYTLDRDGVIVKGIPILETKTSKRDKQGFYYSDATGPNMALSSEDLSGATGKRYGIFISVKDGEGNNEDGTYYIQEAQLFAYITDGSGRTMLPSGEVILPGGVDISEGALAYVATTNYFYAPEDNQDIDDPSQIKYLYIGEGSPYSLDYIEGCAKVRSINAKETNRFNLLQTISETFEAWCRFDIQHKTNGEILLTKDAWNQKVYSAQAENVTKVLDANGETTRIIDANPPAREPKQEDYRQQKFVTFHEKVGQEKNIGFVYGINLRSISRTLDSHDIATKLIVKSNNNQYAKNGSCNIARAKSNPSGESFIFDFTNYISQGLLSYNNLQNDLYSTAEDQGWIGLYTRLKNYNRTRDDLIVKQAALVAQVSKYRSEHEDAVMRWNMTGDELHSEQEKYHKLTGFGYDKIVGIANNDKDPKKDAANSWLTNTSAQAMAHNIEKLKKDLQEYESAVAIAEGALASLEEALEGIEVQLTGIGKETSKLINQFEQKYARFIQEASWIGEDYTDDNLYFIDAETTLHKSAKPKVTYTINLVDVSKIEGYEGYSFDLGDISYVQDPEFFGWVLENGMKTPYREQVVVNEMTTYFNQPEKNVIKVQNYRDNFDDLFQRMTATSQQLQFYSGAYDRAAEVIGPDGLIEPQSLKEAFANNAYVLSNTANQSVRWDEYGITTSDTMNPQDVVRITSGGIYLTEDGGENWTTGISASGINAKTITTGWLDTGIVTIMNGDTPAFKWDESGLKAYKKEQVDGAEIPVGDTYVQFDEFGIYGIDGNADFDPKELNDKYENSIEKIKEESKFALTWDGFALNSSGSGEHKIRISDKDDFQILSSTNKELIKMGRLSDIPGSYGLQIEPERSTTTNPVIIGSAGSVDDTHGRLVIRAGNNTAAEGDDAPFRVYEDGFMYVKNAQIGGDFRDTLVRDIQVIVTYPRTYQDGYVRLECRPVIEQDIINSVNWHLEGNKLEGENKTVLELRYDDLSKLYKQNTPVKIYVKAEVEKYNEQIETEEGPIPAVQTYEKSLEVPIEGVYKVVIEYMNSSNGATPPSDDDDGWQSTAPEFVDGQYRWRKETTYQLGKTPETRYDVAYSDLNLNATAYVFIQDKSDPTKLRPEAIYFEAVAQNVPSKDQKYTWAGAVWDENGEDGAKAILSAQSFLEQTENGEKPLTVSVTYGDRTDSIDILMVKDGESGFSANLTNPTMTFNNDGNATATESTKVEVYHGGSRLSYRANTTQGTGWYYTIEKGSTPLMSIETDGTIVVTNPQKRAQFTIHVLVYQGKDEKADIELQINCVVTGPGSPGDTIRTETAYYLSSSSRAPEERPSGSSLPSGWSFTPQSINVENKYQFVSSCVVTNEVYGEWSAPVLFARYGEDGKKGSDATVNATNVFNAITTDEQGKEKFGCFTAENGKLYVNGDYLRGAILEAGNKEGQVFYANMYEDPPSVRIGGFNITQNGLSSNLLKIDPSGYVIVGSDETSQTDGSSGWLTVTNFASAGAEPGQGTQYRWSKAWTIDGLSSNQTIARAWCECDRSFTLTWGGNRLFAHGTFYSLTEPASFSIKFNYIINTAQYGLKVTKDNQVFVSGVSGSLGQAIKSLDQRLVSLEGESGTSGSGGSADLTPLTNRVTALEGTVGDSSKGLVKRVDTLQTQITDSTTSGTLANKVSGLNSAIGTVQTEINSLKQKVVYRDGFDQELKNSSVYRDVIARIAALESDVNGLQTGISNINNEIEKIWNRIVLLEGGGLIKP